MAKEIRTLKDLKEALKNIPDKTLECLGAGYSSEGGECVSLLCYPNEGKDPEIEANRIFNKYKILDDISKWITNIGEKAIETQSDDYDESEDDDLISSKDKKK